jgi:hypothetical protein
MLELIKMHKLRLLIFGISIPILTMFFEILGIVLWTTLNNDGWKYGLPIIIFGICLFILYSFCYKYMKKKLINVQNEYNEYNATKK